MNPSPPQNKKNKKNRVASTNHFSPSSYLVSMIQPDRMKKIEFRTLSKFSWILWLMNQLLQIKKHCCLMECGLHELHYRWLIVWKEWKERWRDLTLFNPNTKSEYTRDKRQMFFRKRMKNDIAKPCMHSCLYVKATSVHWRGNPNDLWSSTICY